MSLDNVSELVLGGAVFNTQYNDDPGSLPVVDIVKAAFRAGINAIDTSPYYGPSEVLLGPAIAQVLEDLKLNREQIYLCTKVGRISEKSFNYSREHVRASVLRSLQRLRTKYLDLVYVHDVEFETMEHIREAIDELRLLQSEGVVRNVGVSGYPVDFIAEVAQDAQSRGRPLDAVLSYCNLTLQNDRLLDYVPVLEKAGVKYLFNASIMSMSLLTSGETREFHPASSSLRECVAQIAQQSHERHNTPIEDLAVRYALSTFRGKGRTVIGVSSVEELQHTLANRNAQCDDERIVEDLRSSMGDHFNETWSSGVH